MNAKGESEERSRPRGKSGKQKDGRPEKNVPQNEMFDDAFKEYNKQREKQGKEPLGKDQRKRAHKEAGKDQNGYQDLIGILNDMFGGK